MGTLRDEAYEKLDYLSQLTEVVIGPQNEALAAIPDRIELSVENILNLKTVHWGAIHGFVLEVPAVLAVCTPSVPSDVLHDIKDNFDFEVSPDFEVDIKNRQVRGTLAMVKISNQMDEKRILEFAVRRAQRELFRFDWPTKRIKDRTVTVLNVLEAGRGDQWLSQLNGRMQSAAWEAILALLKEVIFENKWRVRDSEVIVKMGRWINAYMKHDEADENVDNGLVNLMKLKLMVNRDLPIYSVQEVK